MNLGGVIRSALAGILCTASFAVAAQGPLEILGLRHRSAEQVLPALRPLLDAGATLTGHGYQLIVRTSPANLAELRQALQAIDRPLARLQISVRFDQAGHAERSGIAVRGEAGSGGARVDVRASGERSASAGQVAQRLQVLEGARAHLLVGEVRAIRLPDASVLYETGTGFTAVPRLAGETVHLEIAPRQQSAAQYQAAATTVSAPLGEWFALGEVVGAASANGARSSESRRIWVKVEALDR